jgi:hypothetical protein
MALDDEAAAKKAPKPPTYDRHVDSVRDREILDHEQRLRHINGQTWGLTKKFQEREKATAKIAAKKKPPPSDGWRPLREPSHPTQGDSSWTPKTRAQRQKPEEEDAYEAERRNLFAESTKRIEDAARRDLETAVAKKAQEMVTAAAKKRQEEAAKRLVAPKQVTVRDPAVKKKADVKVKKKTDLTTSSKATSTALLQHSQLVPVMHMDHPEAVAYRDSPERKTHLAALDRSARNKAIIKLGRPGIAIKHKAVLSLTGKSKTQREATMKVVAPNPAKLTAVAMAKKHVEEVAAKKHAEEVATKKKKAKVLAKKAAPKPTAHIHSLSPTPKIVHPKTTPKAVCHTPKAKAIQPTHLTGEW